MALVVVDQMEVDKAVDQVLEVGLQVLEVDLAVVDQVVEAEAQLEALVVAAMAVAGVVVAMVVVGVVAMVVVGVVVAMVARGEEQGNRVYQVDITK